LKGVRMKLSRSFMMSTTQTIGGKDAVSVCFSTSVFDASLTTDADICD